MRIKDNQEEEVGKAGSIPKWVLSFSLMGY